MKTKQAVSKLAQTLLLFCLTSLLSSCDELMAFLDNPIITSINIRADEMKLTVGQRQQRQATTVSPATVVYASADPAVATVDATGTVTAIAPGTTTITASVAAVDYWTAAQVSYQVSVVGDTSTPTPAPTPAPTPISADIPYVGYTVSGATATAANLVALEGQYTVLSSSTSDVNFKSGTYVVNDDVTISGRIILNTNADINLIICDGKELKVSAIRGNATLRVYGQTAGTGKLTVNYTGSGTSNAIEAKYLYVHGGVVTAKSNNYCGMWIAKDINLYNGEIIANGGTQWDNQGCAGICLRDNLNVYHGNIEAQGGESTKASSYANGIFFFPEGSSEPELNNYGGTIIAKGGNDKTTDGGYTSAGICVNNRIEIYNYGIIQCIGSKGPNNAGGLGLELAPSAQYQGTGEMTLIGGDGKTGGYSLKGTLEYRTGKLTVLGGFSSDNTRNRVYSTGANIQNKNIHPIMFQYSTDGINWNDAGSTASKSYIANHSVYKGIRVGY